MESSCFDTLVKALAVRRPRRAVLPVLVALGLGLFESDATGAKKKAEKKVPVCNCASADVATCQSQKKAKFKAKKLLQTNPCAYPGGCTGMSGCAVAVPPPPPDGPPPCASTHQCGAGCCDPTQCFAETVSDVDRRPLAFGCCPALLLCLSTTPSVPDQCCYPDETCDPTLPARTPAGQEPTLCCRSCGGVCCESFEACRDGVCTPLPTARLPRTRRP